MRLRSQLLLDNCDRNLQNSFMYPRLIEDRIVSGINSGKVLIIYGPRQVGKTTLAKKVAGDQGQYLYLNCDEPDVRLALTDRNSSELKRLIGDYSFVVIDEAQRVPNIGLTLKIMGLRRN